MFFTSLTSVIAIIVVIILIRPPHFAWWSAIFRGPRIMFFQSSQYLTQNSVFWVICFTNRAFWFTKRVFWIIDRVFLVIGLMLSIFSMFSVFYMFSIFSHPGWQDGTIFGALILITFIIITFVCSSSQGIEMVVMGPSTILYGAT